MPAHRSLDSGTAHLPKSMRAAQGQSLQWKERAACRSPRGVPKFAWTVEEKEKGPQLLGRPAEAWIALALQTCRTCPAQYDCVRFALAVKEQHNTWGINLRDLLALHRLDGAGGIVDWAESRGVPVQDAVASALHR